MFKKILLPAFLVAITVVGTVQAQKSKSYELASPGRINKIKFNLDKTAPKYEVSHGKTQVLTPSDMGFTLKNNDDFSTNFEVVDVKNSTFDETWEQVWGEKKKIRNHYNQMIVQLQQKNAEKRKLEIQFRAYDDGVAFRYVYPNQGTKDSIFIMDEKTTFNLKEDGKAWWIPAYKENRYEYLYTASPVSTLDTFHTPLTIESKAD